VRETLKKIKSLEIKTALLTTKAQDQADKITNHFGLAADLDYIMGRRPGIAHKPSPEPLLKICDDLSIKPENCMIVGDSEMDIQCGKNANAKTCGVTYGYRTREDLQKESPDFVVDNMGELQQIVEG
jgi:HAD superfamily hydrolase (TIGR01509 family)